MRVHLDMSTDPATIPSATPSGSGSPETDAMGVLHHAAYVPYLEEARVEYLRALGHPYAADPRRGHDLAVLELAVQYRRSARFEDVVHVHTRVSAVPRAPASRSTTC